MNTINRITYTGSQRPIKGATSAKQAAVELTRIDPLTNAERFGRYCQKLNAGWVVGKARVAGGVA